MANATYIVEVGWENNKDFLGLYDDITADVKNVHFARGKSDELGKAIIGNASVVVNNDDEKYAPLNVDSVLYGYLLPKRPLRIYATQQLVAVSVTKSIAAAGDYAAEDVMSESATVGTEWKFSDVTKYKGGYGQITKAQVIAEITQLTPRLSLYLFTALPTCNLNDNVANTALLHADLDNYIGKIDFPPMEDLGGCSETLATPSTFGNLTIPFNCATDSTHLYGVLVTRDAITGETATMEMTVRLTIELPNYPLFFGYIEDIIPHPDLTQQDCIITATDGGDYLSRHILNTALYTDTVTGIIHSYILDDALWNQDMRLLDDGQTTVPFWHGFDINALKAQGEIDDAEQGFSFVDGAGDFRFEDRHHRSTMTHQTSQTTFDSSGFKIKYSINPRNIYNIIEASMTPKELQESAELWRLKETPCIPPGETRTYWGKSNYLVKTWAAIFPTLDLTANSQADGNGTDMTSDMFRVATPFARTIKVAITNMTGTVPAYITLLKARGTYYTDLAQVTFNAEDSDSQTAYQKRTKKVDGKYLTNVDVAQSYCDYAIGRYKDPLSDISLSVLNLDETNLNQILRTEISDRITIVNDDLGLSKIDVGSAATNRTSAATGSATFIDLANPVLHDGIINSVDVWVSEKIYGFRIGIFYLVSGTTYMCRDSTTAFAWVIPGSKQTFSVNLPAIKGDYIGCYWPWLEEVGGIETSTTGGSGVMFVPGEYVDPGDSVSYVLLSDYAISLYGTGVKTGYFIDYMAHDISNSGLLHKVTYRLADAENEDFWCLNYSAMETQTKLGY